MDLFVTVTCSNTILSHIVIISIVAPFEHSTDSVLWLSESHEVTFPASHPSHLSLSRMSPLGLLTLCSVAAAAPTDPDANGESFEVKQFDCDQQKYKHLVV